MAKVYNIMNKMVNVKPTVKIDEEHEYKINNTKNNAIYIQSLARGNDKKGDKNYDEMEFMNKIIKASLGQEAFEYIDSKGEEWSMAQYEAILNVIMAAVSNVELEEIEELSKKEAKRFQESEK
ncbi:TPA: hypothetical protein ACOTGY_001388 [Clostridium perfringens]|jgi:hypothetical protein|uniref:hypothetical protein n=1 Tax=Clostridium perfringens TaxID=1502 RepID=UPI0009922569|nr:MULTISPECIES: hypothetical protein [Clostridium]WEV14796.1 hypothetical protein PL325_08590 [Clostridium perfringens D]DAJ44199.1 MAG TPA: hypothetical protein [Caudoviricetes sp.]AQW23495.1 hypothetical protein BXT91_06095 [Clostridium perfringens]ATD48921.1 hypothetical protein CMR01_09060 [Clostridium perfringens]EJT6152869.1 hypothetical protein [Clostridium perfringens]